VAAVLMCAARATHHTSFIVMHASE